MGRDEDEVESGNELGDGYKWGRRERLQRERGKEGWWQWQWRSLAASDQSISICQPLNTALSLHVLPVYSNKSWSLYLNPSIQRLQIWSFKSTTTIKRQYKWTTVLKNFEQRRKQFKSLSLYLIFSKYTIDRTICECLIIAVRTIASFEWFIRFLYL